MVELNAFRDGAVSRPYEIEGNTWIGSGGRQEGFAGDPAGPCYVC